ncbi:ribonuclease III [Clavulina sp. PMI_390]|nr:ribonuclease III [Clavulina sp. PMI_390]
MLSAAFTFPPLPSIISQTLRKEVFHPRFRHDANVESRNTARINQRLEFLGDSVMALCTTWLLDLDYPELSTHEASYLKGQLVSNRLFSLISKEYGLIDGVPVFFSRRDYLELSRDEKVHANLFEAYVGAAFMESNYDIATIQPFVFSLLRQFARTKYDDMRNNGVPHHRKKHSRKNSPSEGAQHATSSSRLDAFASFSSAIVQPPDSPRESNWGNSSDESHTTTSRSDSPYPTPPPEPKGYTDRRLQRSPGAFYSSHKKPHRQIPHSSASERTRHAPPLSVDGKTHSPSGPPESY